MSTHQAVHRLQLFNRKAEELTTLSFASKAFGQTAGFSLHIGENQFRSEKRGADREATAAFVLTLRLFLQPRDKLQLQQIEQLYRALPVQDEKKSLVAENLSALNVFLDGTGSFEVSVNGIPLTNRLILEAFLYGDFAHLNEDKRALREIITLGPLNLMIESQFEYVVGEVMRFIFWLARMNATVIQELEKQDTPREI